MKKVQANVDFKDRYTGKVYKAGKTYQMSEERVAEIKETDKKLITVVGVVAERKAAEKPEEEEDEPVNPPEE